MQRVVRLNTNDVLQVVLKAAGSHVGFVHDKHMRTALLTALFLEKYDATAMLLEAVASGRVSTMPSSLAAVVECLPVLAGAFPKILLGLMCKMPLDAAPEMLSSFQRANQAVFASMLDGDSLVQGSKERTGPSLLWKSACDASDERNSRSAHDGELRSMYESVIAKYGKKQSSSVGVVEKDDFDGDAKYISANFDGALVTPGTMLGKGHDSHRDHHHEPIVTYDAVSRRWRLAKTPVSAGVRLYAALCSLQWTLFVCSLCLAQVVVDVFMKPTSGTLAFSYVASGVFFVELCLRLKLTSSLKHSVLHFFRSVCNVLGKCTSCPHLSLMGPPCRRVLRVDWCPLILCVHKASMLHVPGHSAFVLSQILSWCSLMFLRSSSR